MRVDTDGEVGGGGAFYEATYMGRWEGWGGTDADRKVGYERGAAWWCKKRGFFVHDLERGTGRRLRGNIARGGEEVDAKEGGGNLERLAWFYAEGQKLHSLRK